MIRLASILAAVLMVATVAARAEDWPTAAHDAARTGRTAERLGPPFRVLWTKTWPYEKIATVSQLIVAGRRGFIGTLGRDGSVAGKVRAVRLADGADAWCYDKLKGGVAHSLTHADHEGPTVYAATTLGEVVALDAATGRQRWKADVGFGGFVCNPCVIEKTVLLGGRDGWFYAFGPGGRPKWKRKVGVPIHCTAAAADGVVYFLDEAIRAHALRIADGSCLTGWPTKPLPGGSARHYWPVVAGRYVLFRVAPPHRYNWGQTDGVLFAGVEGVSRRKEADYLAVGTPEQARLEQQRVIAHLRAHPHDQVLHCLRRSDGSRACVPGVFYVGGSGSVGCPPVLDRDGRILTVYRSYWSVYDSRSWVNPFSAIGVLDPGSGLVEQIKPYGEAKPAAPWGHVWIIADESSSFSVAGEVLYVCHQGNFGGVGLERGGTFKGVGKRDTWGGHAATSWHRQEWHGAPRSPLTIAGGVAYYVVGGRVIACAGKGAQ